MFTTLILPCKSARGSTQCSDLGTQDVGNSFLTHASMVTKVRKIGHCEMCGGMCGGNVH